MTVSTKSRIETKFAASDVRIENEIDKTGKKNLKHRDDILIEISRANSTVANFLASHLPEINSDWETDVATAFYKYGEKHTGYKPPANFNIADYDFRNTMILLDEYLESLTLERDATLSHSEISFIVRIRNNYEHNTLGINKRDWKQDLAAIKKFRSAFLTPAEIEAELFESNNLLDTSVDSTVCNREMLALQSQIDILAQQQEKLMAVNATKTAELEKHLNSVDSSLAKKPRISKKTGIAIAVAIAVVGFASLIRR